MPCNRVSQFVARPRTKSPHGYCGRDFTKSVATGWQKGYSLSEVALESRTGYAWDVACANFGTGLSRVEGAFESKIVAI